MRNCLRSSCSLPPMQRSSRARNAAEWLWCTVWHNSCRMTKSCNSSGRVTRNSDNERLFCDVQQPHFERVARIVTRPYRKPNFAASCATLVGSVCLAMARSCSICSGVCAGVACCASRSFVRSIHSRLLSKNSKARRVLMLVGYDTRTSPEGRTDMDTRTTRRLCERVTIPRVS